MFEVEESAAVSQDRVLVGTVESLGALVHEQTMSPHYLCASSNEHNL